METFTRGDIVLYAFPHTNLKERKLRPCLVLSNEMKNDILLCQITSQKSQKDKFSIELLTTDTKEGSLLINSFIRANMLFTAEKFDIRKKVCIIKPDKYKLTTKVIKSIIDLN